ncbi:coproporphyrinogen III oxidase [Synergistales bacterium]|nr:coproporphyrinogen III oxidase [Synergistales bacterium]
MENPNISLYEDDVVYRPPLEAKSALLEVAYGCTWGRCTFCRQQKANGFRKNSLSVIEEKLRLLSEMNENQEKTGMFLLGANVLVLSPRILKEIFILVHRYLPKIEKISMFARCDDVMRKSDGALLELKAMGLGDLYVGLESGSDKVLRMCDKGMTSRGMLDTFNRLDRLNISYSLSSITGLGGKELSLEHALETAALYSNIHPKTIRVMTLTPWPGTPLFQSIASGEFEELSPWEALLEERIFLSQLNLTKECLFVGTHVSNNIPLAGLLPRHKEPLLKIMDEVLSQLNPGYVQKASFGQW